MGHSNSTPIAHAVPPRVEMESGTIRPAASERRGLAGEALRTREIDGFTIREDVYPVGFVLPRHYHPHAYLTYVIEGSYFESYGGHSSYSAPGGLRFLPSGQSHENRSEAGLRCLHVKIDPLVLDRLREDAPVLDRPADISGLASTWLANRLYIEFCHRDTASPLAMEGVILEILAEGARSGNQPMTRPPSWLKLAKELLECRFLEPLSLAQIAAAVGVHHVHLSREFRKHNRCTVGEFIRQRRIEHACNLLAHSETSLAEIALICGFSDQSHFSLMFKRHMGMTPSKFRELTAVR